MNVRTSILLIACFGGSALVGWTTTHRSGRADAGDPSSPAQSASSTRTVRAAGDERAKVATAMAPVRAAKDRWAAIQAAVELAHRISPDEIHRWLHKELFQYADHEVEEVFYRALRDRYFELDPEVCLRDMIARRHKETSEYFARWVALDSVAVIGFIANLQGQESGKGLDAAWMEPTLSALAESDPARLLEHSASWGKELRVVASRHATAAWLKQDFSGCLAWLGACTEGKRLFLEGLQRVGSASEVGKSLVLHIKELPDGWAAELCKSSSFSFAYGAADEWLAADLEGAGVPAAYARRARSATIRTLAIKHPDRALEAYARLGDMPDTERYDLVFSLIDRMGSRLELTRQWADGLEGDLRQAALDRIEGNTPKKRNDSAQKPNDPNRPVAEQLQDVIAGKLNLYDFANSPDRINDTLRAIQELPAAQVAMLASKFDTNGSSWPNRVKGELILRRLAVAPEADPQRLIRSAATTGTRWAAEDPAAASSWVGSLPAGDARHWAILNTAAQWYRDDPVAAQRWIEKLPEKDRAAAQDGVKK